MDKGIICFGLGHASQVTIVDFGGHVGNFGQVRSTFMCKPHLLQGGIAQVAHRGHIAIVIVIVLDGAIAPKVVIEADGILATYRTIRSIVE
jgi:hypothetical protein